MIKKEKVEKLFKYSLTNPLIIVEGKRDEEALRLFGFNRIIKISGKPLEEVVRKVDEKVAILTDFDEEGRKIKRELVRMFERKGVKVDNYLRRLIRSFGITKIEELKYVKEFYERRKAE